MNKHSAPRRGELHIEKDCSTYFGRAGDFCTITVSNVEAIGVGTRIVYASDAVGVALDTDIALYPPGGGDDAAFGHRRLSLATGVGVCKLLGGTGGLTGFRAKAAVSPLGGPHFAWDGNYRFRGKGTGDTD